MTEKDDNIIHGGWTASSSPTTHSFAPSDYSPQKGNDAYMSWERRKSQRRREDIALVVTTIGALIVGGIAHVMSQKQPNYTPAQIADALAFCNRYAKANYPLGTTVTLNPTRDPICAFTLPIQALATPTNGVVGFPNTGYPIPTP